MDARLLKLPLALLLAFGVAAGASAQTRSGQDAATLPVWNSASGKVPLMMVMGYSMFWTCSRICSIKTLSSMAA